MSEGRSVARRARRIVVKVGSNVLTRDGHLHARAFSEVTRQVAELHAEGRQVVIVSSGAIAIGSRSLAWKTHAGTRRRSIPEMQAAAAVGQIGLVDMYKRRFARHGQQVAQVLLTRGGLENRERFLNARHTLETLLELGVIPVVNENDTVATEEIRFGDNDNLSATVVNLVSADLLILLTDVDGFYSEPPVPGKRNRGSKLDVVEKIDRTITDAAKGSGSAFGRGGMITKLEAVRAAAHCGAATVIGNGRRRGTIVRIAAGEPEGTLFVAGKRLASRKHWLAFTAQPRGEILLDDGAVRALVERKRSLLPAGVVGSRGRFRIGDSVTCVDRQGRERARGLTAYSSDELARIQGLATGKIAQVLGYSNGNAVIHRDDLVVIDGGDEIR